jgi:hypothetical protein
VEGVFDRPVLEGNQERQEEEFAVNLALLLREKAEELEGIGAGVGVGVGVGVVAEFEGQLSKDFSCEIAVRVRLACAVL